MKLLTESYLNQKMRWPNTGRHILAQFDDDTVVVYQAYRPAIGHFAAERGYFGGEFSLNRMSWIKPNFLWMMYRSEWGTKPGQEVILAVSLKRSAFDEILASVVHSNFVSAVYGSEKEWKQAVKNSSVRLQWDPDHHPSGAKLERRAIQLGLRGSYLASYAQEWIVNIEDISEFVQQQHQYNTGDLAQLLTPRETVYPVTNPDICQRLGVSIS
ncbi:MAG: DUF4291 domain-containing protein [Microcoleus sp. PH2017_01_SCD_O_A]|uniref:DUF4291 domain-containing protein n=1 Tax=unclassified Microcoleus TaxID=2642155 RepID=UPI001DD91EAA|nr:MULTISPECIES: DUF4291 domain-containing protein [unclassified Microcoleus]TAE66957.1 MAG: DUF4291 domain-containing protein [Oscillatoriales cyanobacterium]MCC3424782.1 DUF4291 domain-containing protein [Microcoleus sp. PH2017_01_SCD_O_A]MCC3455555.1 DUF4291 domain-containing protein [Microcoleus sp. PH2017_08_TRC_O_A]MCC3567313.1 DUF4291 domain-containing protein [Microcoleus sp. PH2017_31_RDM_U_A]MCC3579646.1 DUF4291 domain-containing protein [Microcoleus sp. PH2017_32_RDM_D_A]